MSGYGSRVKQFAVILFLDGAAETAVHALTERLVANGLAAESSVPPHITLAVCVGLDADGFRSKLAQLAAETPVVHCTLASLGVFPTDEGVIFLAPTTSRVLVDVQEQMIQRLGQSGAQVEPYWIPGSWVPHCTLAAGIPRERVASGLGVIYDAFRPIACELTQVSLVDVSLGETCYAFELRAT
jgi:2'-5' RNA ligase